MALIDRLLAGIPNADSARRNSKLGVIMQRRGVGRTPDFLKVSALPRRVWETAPELPELTRLLTNSLRTPGGTMELWPTQAQALADCHDCAGLFAPMGVGKGKALVSLLAPVVMGAARPVLLVPAALREQTRLRVIPEMARHWRLHRGLRVIGYSELSLAHKADLLDELNPDLIVMDECFTAETKIATPEGPKAIADLREGCKVWQWSLDKGITKQTVTYCGNSTPLTQIKIKLKTGHTITTTPFHPFFTSRGWVAARSLTNDTRLVCAQTDERSNEKENLGYKKSWVCRGFVRKNETTGNSALQGKQSNAIRTDSEKSIPDIKKDRPQTAHSGGEWKREAQSAAYTNGCFKRLGGGICSVYRAAVKRIPDVLQNRFGQCRSKNSVRNRWPVPLLLEGTSGRQKENEVFGNTRLVGIAGIEHRRVDQPTLRITMYNIETTGAHSYILADSGAVVHNCHYAKNTKAGRTKRLSRYLREHPDTRVVAMSGTVTRKSLRDYWHIIRWALGPGMPLPGKWQELCCWADALDLDVDDAVRMNPGVLLDWCDDGESVYDGFRRRLTETYGVVATSAEDLGTSLEIAEYKIEVSEAINKALTKLRANWETPNGDFIVETLDMWRHAQSLALGFWYRWRVPGPRDWLQARRAWKTFVRETLQNNRRGLDTELQVWNECVEADTDQVWFDWKNIKDAFKPDPVVEWFDDSILKAAADWLKEEGIAWVSHVEFGERLAELAHVPYYGGGEKASREILDARGPIVASIAAHGEGKNLQRYYRNLVVAPPSSGRTWEQLLGRTHRSGQQADTVLVDVMVHTTETLAAFEAARKEARHIERSIGSKQKLNFADILF